MHIYILPKTHVIILVSLYGEVMSSPITIPVRPFNLFKVRHGVIIGQMINSKHGMTVSKSRLDDQINTQLPSHDVFLLTHLYTQVRERCNADKRTTPAKLI